MPTGQTPWSTLQSCIVLLRASSDRYVNIEYFIPNAKRWPKLSYKSEFVNYELIIWHNINNIYK